MRTLASAAATALVFSLASCGTAGAPALRIVSSISEGAALSSALQWTAVPAGVRSADPVAEVDFLVDGRRRWTDRQAPFVFNGDHNALHPWILARGRHRLAVRLVTAQGRTVGTASQVSIAPAPAVARALAGRWTRRLTAVHVRGIALPIGAWHARFRPDGVVFLEGPHGWRGTEAFTPIRTGLIALAGPVLWLAPERRRGILCPTEQLAPYEWHRHGSALTLTSRHDRHCPNRAALFGGTWTHDRAVA